MPSQEHYLINQQSPGLEVSGYRQYNIKHIQITHDQDSATGAPGRSLAEGDEPGASRLTHSQLSQKYDTGALGHAAGLAQLAEQNGQSASKASPSKQKKINVAKFMFDQEKGYKKPEFYQPEPHSMINAKPPILSVPPRSLREHALITNSNQNSRRTSPQTQSPTSGAAANVKSGVGASKASDAKASNLRPDGSRKTGDVELASQILKRVLE